MVRDWQLRRTSGDEPLEARLREVFESEIAAQTGQVPDLHVILLMARIDALTKKQARVAAIESSSAILTLGTIVTLVAVWWTELASGLKALFPIASGSFSWETSDGVAASLLTILLFWSKTLVRHG